MATHEAIAQALPSPRLGERACNLIAQFFCHAKRWPDQFFWNVGLVGEINPRLNQRQRGYDFLAPHVGPIADQTLKLPKCLAALRRSFSRNQIRQALDGGEIEPAVIEGAAGKLTGLGRPAPFDAFQRVEHRSDDGVTAVELQLRHVVAGFAVRTRKPQHQRLIDNFAGRGIPHARERGLARFRNPTDELFQSAKLARGPHRRTTAIAAGCQPEERA